MLRILAFLCALMAPALAFAQCNPANKAGVPFNCAAGNIPGPTDLFLGGSNSGNNAGSTVAFTGAQVVAMDHSGSPVTVGNTTKPLSSWMLQFQNFGTTPITIGGQAIYLGGATQNQGNGPLIALATGTFTAGHCRQTDANGNEVDSGGACGGGGTGGSGSVTSGLLNQMAYYSAAGTVVTGLPTANNGVLSTSSAGVPSIATTLPSGLTIPAPTISGANLTGTTNAASITASGKVTTPASTASAAGLTITPGVAPTTPNNGDIWVTTSGVNARVNGATVALSAGAGLSAVTAAAPLAGSGTSASPLVCATCVTTSGGGALSATAPITVNAAGLIALGVQPGSGVIQWPSSVTVTADTYYYALSWPWATGTITGITYATGGSGTPSFTAGIQIAGASVTGCSAVTVNSATAATATCTAANTITRGQKVTLVVSAVSGTPNAAQVQLTYTRSAN